MMVKIIKLHKIPDTYGKTLEKHNKGVECRIIYKFT